MPCWGLKIAAQDTQNCNNHHAVEQEGGQIVTGLEQDPDRSDRSDGDVHTTDEHPSGVGEHQGMEIQADGQADDDGDDADDTGDAQRGVAAIDQEAEDDGHDDEQDGDHGHGRMGAGLSGGHIPRRWCQR